MGGEREKTVEQREVTPKGEKTVGSVRFHESKGQVHFHDDANALKVAVPAGRWSKQWEEFSSGLRKKIELIDKDRKTRLIVKRAKGKGAAKNVLNVTICVEAVQFSPEFQSLDAFSNP